jgi:hypothetical protein
MFENTRSSIELLGAEFCAGYNQETGGGVKNISSVSDNRKWVIIKLIILRYTKIAQLI